MAEAQTTHPGGIASTPARTPALAVTNPSGNRNRIALLPFLILGFTVSIFSVSRAAISQTIDAITGAEFHWDKTERFRKAES